MSRLTTADAREYARRRIVQLAEFTEEALYFARVTNEDSHAADLHLHAGLYATEALYMARLTQPEPHL